MDTNYNESSLRKAFYLQERLMDRLFDNCLHLNSLFQGLKNDKKEYGYYHSREVFDLHRILQKYECKSIIDLGCGMGLLMAQLHCLDSSYRVAGIENEKLLVNVAIINARWKDILSLEPSDIQDFDCLYIWEPIKDEEQCQRLVNTLSKCMSSNQLLVCKCAGVTGQYLIESDDFYPLCEEGTGFQLFKRF